MKNMRRIYICISCRLSAFSLTSLVKWMQKQCACFLEREIYRYSYYFFFSCQLHVLKKVRQGERRREDNKRVVCTLCHLLRYTGCLFAFAEEQRHFLFDTKSCYAYFCDSNGSNYISVENKWESLQCNSFEIRDRQWFHSRITYNLN